MAINVRQATLEDAEGISQVHVLSWQEAYKGIIADDSLENLNPQDRVPMWQARLKQPSDDVNVYVAEDRESGIVGFASGGPERDGSELYTGELYAIYLLQRAHGQGVGRKMAMAVIRHLQQAGYDAMIVWVLKDNAHARGFYEALGGVYVAEKAFTLYGQTLLEVAYGWRSLSDSFPLKST